VTRKGAAIDGEAASEVRQQCQIRSAAPGAISASRGAPSGSVNAFGPWLSGQTRVAPFSSVKSVKVVARIGQTLGGARAVAIGKAAIEVAKHWPVKTIEKVMAGSAGRALVSAGEHIALSANKALVPVGAVDGVYARVMSASYAQKLATGGTLAAGDLAFITEAKAIEGLSKWDDVRRRLSLMDPLKIGEFRAFADDVIVEFKFASNEPLAFLAKPFGEVGRFGPAFLPGGYTAGGAPEWVVDALAAEKNMLDIGSIKIRPIKP